MRRLILLRHAKSAWDDPELPDHDRILNKRGRRSCAVIGPWLCEKGYLPDQVLCSTAARTIETWGLVSRSLPKPPAAMTLRDLYLASPDTMIGVLRDATGHCVALVGHNPGIGQMAEAVVAAPPRHPAFSYYPTMATLIVDFPIDDWAGLMPGTGQVVDFTVPRDLGI